MKGKMFMSTEGGDIAEPAPLLEPEQSEKGKPSKLGESSFRIGVVATNQSRKDWGLMGQVCAGLLDSYPGHITFWFHVDQLVRYWSIPAILADYGLEEVTEVTVPPMTDSQLAERYRSCSVTLHPGLGEGFGYPIFESLACGVPAIHGGYGGGASILSTCGLQGYLVAPYGERLDTQHNCYRPVYDPRAWTEKVQEVMASKQEPRHSVLHLDWQAIGPRWRRWFCDGVQMGDQL